MHWTNSCLQICWTRFWFWTWTFRCWIKEFYCWSWPC